MYASYNQSVSSSEDDCANQIKETVKFFNKEELQNLVDNDSKLTELVTENPGVGVVLNIVVAFLRSLKNFTFLKVRLKGKWFLISPLLLVCGILDVSYPLHS